VKSCKFELKLEVSEAGFKIVEWSKFCHSSHKEEHAPKTYKSVYEAVFAVKQICVAKNRNVKKNGKSLKGNQRMSCPKEGSLFFFFFFFFFSCSIKGCHFGCQIVRVNEHEYVITNWQNHTCSPLLKADVLHQFSTIPSNVKDFLESLALSVGMKEIKKSVSSFIEKENVTVTWSEDDVNTYVNCIRRMKLDIELEEAERVHQVNDIFNETLGIVPKIVKKGRGYNKFATNLPLYKRTAGRYQSRRYKSSNTKRQKSNKSRL